jgi:hypothetical protein
MAAKFADHVKRSRNFDRVAFENTFLRKRLSELELELLDTQKKAALQTRPVPSRTFRSLVRLHNVLARAGIVRGS